MKIIILFVVFIGASCSHIVSKDEFKKHLDKYKMVDATYKQSVKVTAEQMLAYGNKCLGVQKSQGGSVFSKVEPTMDTEGDKINLYVKQTFYGSFSQVVEMYLFWAQVSPGPKNTTNAKIYYYESSMGPNGEDINKRFHEWVKKERRLCPNF